MPKGVPTKTKTCPICGDEFLPEKPSQRYCKKDHYQPCPICGKPVLWNSMREVPVCSKECKRERMHRRNQEKYGVDHPMALKSVQEKHKASMKEHYGVEHALQSSELKEKAKSTTRDRYGVDWAMSNESVKRKAQDAMEAKYGYRTSFQSPGLMAKARKTMIEKYGVDNPLKSEVVRNKIKATNVERYGVENVAQNPDIQSKIKATKAEHQDQITENIRQAFREIYGVDNCRQSPIVISKIKQTLKRNYGVDVPFKSDEIKQRASKTIMERYGVPWFTLTDEFKNGRPSELESPNGCVSNINKKFAEYLREHGISNVVFEKKIENRFFDLFLPDLKTVIEIDPSYTHNTEGLNIYNRKISLDYHKEKTDLANKYGYRCIHVFDWDPWFKILQLLQPTKPIYARKCEIVKILDKKVADEFIDANHLQGCVRGNLLTIGLTYNGDLVQIMSFGKSRYNKRYKYELLRLCTKVGYRVTGGASRLFNFAVKYLDMDSIISYCDLSKFSGSVYENMDMKLEKVTSPAIVWSNKSDKITSNLLRQRGFDQLFKTSYGKGTDNEILMLEHGWLPVPDCGQAVYTFDCGV